MFLVTCLNESFLRYADLIYSLYKDGFNVYTYDHQGQGFSERWISETQPAAWVNNFSDYSDDLSFYANLVSREHPRVPIYAVGCGLGGLVVAITISRTPCIVSKALLITPLLRCRCGLTLFNYVLPIPEPIAYWVTSLLCLAGLGSLRSIGFLNLENRISISRLSTSDEEELDALRDLRDRYSSSFANYLTNDWVKLCIQAQRQFSRRYKFVKTSTLILCAEHDELAHNRAIVDFSKNAALSKVLIADAKHDLLFETPPIR